MSMMMEIATLQESEYNATPRQRQDGGQRHC
jgi:hypothetical protein